MEMESDYLQAAAFLDTADCRCFMTNGTDQHIACVVLMSCLGKVLHYIGCARTWLNAQHNFLTHPLRICQSLIVATWKATSARMHATLAKVDTESAAIMNVSLPYLTSFHI